MRVFRLKEPIDKLSVGTLFYKGEYHREEQAVEWFDMTTEMGTGHSYSYFHIEEHLEQASEEEAGLVMDYLHHIASHEAIRYGKYTIVQEDDPWRIKFSEAYMFYPTAEGVNHDADYDGERYRYCGNCRWASSVEDAMDQIDDLVAEAQG